MLYLRIDKKNQCENYNLFRLYASNGPNLKGDSIGKRNIDFSVTALGLCNKDKETTANASKGEIISGINHKLINNNPSSNQGKSFGFPKRVHSTFSCDLDHHYGINQTLRETFL